MKKNSSKIALNKLKIARISNLSTVKGGNNSEDDAVCRSRPLIRCTNGNGNGDGNINIIGNTTV